MDIKYSILKGIIYNLFIRILGKWLKVFYIYFYFNLFLLVEYFISKIWFEFRVMNIMFSRNVYSVGGFNLGRLEYFFFILWVFNCFKKIIFMSGFVGRRKD